MLTLRFRTIPSVLIICVVTFISGCVAVNDPLIGKAEATLKGSEFGPSDELLADIHKAELYIKENENVLQQLKAANFYEISEKASVRGMTDEFNGDSTRAQATYNYYAKLPLNQGKLKSQLSDVVQRLVKMEEVRKQTNYVQLVKTQGAQNERMRQAQLANTNSLQSALNNNANFYKSLGSGPDVIRYKDSRGSYQDTTTFKGQVRESTIANQRMAEEQLKRGNEALANERQDAARSQQAFLDRNPGLSEVKDYISGESDIISDKLWPALKVTLAELGQLLNAADPSKNK